MALNPGVDKNVSAVYHTATIGSAEVLLEALLGYDPSIQPLTPLLIARTEGNPFFLEESVRALVEAGVLVGPPVVYRLAQAGLAEQVNRLAYHALRGEVWNKALTYCQQVGDKAMARSAYREVVGYFEQALNALPHLPEERHTLEQAIDLRLALCAVLHTSGDFSRPQGIIPRTCPIPVPYFLLGSTASLCTLSSH